MNLLDWIIVVLYVLVVLCVGAWHARRNKTQDDFFLGDRRCRSLPVALSLFVSWFSVISYLTWPGEVIAHGPLIFVGLVGAPVVLWFIGWVIIPRIVWLNESGYERGHLRWNAEVTRIVNACRVTSAYELLDDIGCRRLGSTLFLLMRFAWMSMITYIISTVIVAPITGIQPWCVAAVIIGVTVAYSLGGFRAVVWTDCLQAAIMFGGAVFVLWTLGIRWPTSLPVQWCPASLSFDPTIRVTVPWAILSAACLGVCVKCGDQMNVQRFLSVPTVASAQRVLILGFIFDVLLTGLLALVGVALLLHCGSGPIPEADNLFPWFIAEGLPVGCTGLVIAALLAAAMSSLSSGINACVSTVAVDWQQNLGPGTSMCNRSKMLPSLNCNVVESWHCAIPATVFIGIIVLLLSLGIGLVEGNLLELCYKIVNLLATPLGGLMLTALFIPRCHPLAAWIGCGASVVVVVWINYFSPFTFLLASPLGLTVQLSIGVMSWILGKNW